MEEKERYEVKERKMNQKYKMPEMEEMKSAFNKFAEETKEFLQKYYNQQDKQTKELEEENKELEIKLAKSEKERELDNSFWKQECDSLQKQLHELPNKIVEEIRKWGQKHYNWVGDGTGYDGQDYNECIGFNMAIDQLNEILDTILKKYGGKDE